MAGREKRAYTLKHRELAQKLGREIQRKGETIYKNESISSLSQLAFRLDIKSPSTLQSLTREQEDELLDWVITKNHKAEAVNADEIIQYCEDNFSWNPKRPWVSKFARRNKMASHMTQKKPAKRNRETSEVEIEDFRRNVNDETARLKRAKKHLPRIWTVDEFGIWDDDIRKRGYSHNLREHLILIFEIPS